VLPILLHGVILLQTVRDLSLSPDVLLPEKEAFNISPTNVYGWLIYGLLGFVAYLKLESTLKSWTIRQKDKYIKELHEKLMEAEKTSITKEEALLYKNILLSEKDQSTLLNPSNESTPI
jgi:hypothetical protein